MKKNNFMGRFLYKLRSNNGYNKGVRSPNKSYYRKQFKNLVICIVIVLIVLLLKSIDTKPTQEAIDIVNRTLNHDTNTVKAFNSSLNYVKGIIDGSENVLSVLNPEDKPNVGYLIPVSGTIYQSFGNEIKGNNITVFHEGIKINTKDDIVKSIGEGEVLEINEDKLLGNQVIIDYGEIKAIYGYLAEVSVNIGHVVGKGDKIGKVDTRGDGKKLLYLEIRKNDKPIDPLDILNYNSSRLVAR